MADFTLNGTTGADILNAPGSVPTQVNAFEGNDTIALARATDIAFAGADNDRITLATAAVTSNTVQGGSGSDTVRLAGGTTVNLASIALDDGNDFLRHTAATTLLTSTIYGGKGNDTIVLTGANTLTQLSILAGADQDSISLGANILNNGLIKGGDHADTLRLGTLRGGILAGNKGADRVTITNISGATVQAGAGFDRVSAATISGSTVLGGSGSDTIILAAGGATVGGGGLDDRVSVGANFAGAIWGDGIGVTTAGTGTGGEADGADRVTGSTLSATNLSVYGAGGDDTIRFTTIRSGANVLFNGGDNNDSIIFGSAVAGANITVEGGNGADSIRFGNLAATSIFNATLGAGNDRASGALFGGTILGGAGIDTINVAALNSSTLIDGGSVGDTISVFGALAINSSIYGGDGADSISITGTVTTVAGRSINGGAGNDSITLGNGSFANATFANLITLNGGEGADSVKLNGVNLTGNSALGVVAAAAGASANALMQYGASDNFRAFTANSFANGNWVANNQIRVINSAGLNAGLLSTTTGAIGARGSIGVFGDSINNRTVFYVSTGRTTAMALVVNGADLVTTTAVGNVAVTSAAFAFSLARVSGNNGLSLTLI